MRMKSNLSRASIFFGAALLLAASVANAAPSGGTFSLPFAVTHAQSPQQSRVSPEWQNPVLHAGISIGDAELMAADIPNAEPMRSAYLTLRVDSDTEAESVFSALSDGGQVLMPMQETFFASRFGQVRDRFGINWMILHELPMPR